MKSAAFSSILGGGRGERLDSTHMAQYYVAQISSEVDGVTTVAIGFGPDAADNTLAVPAALEAVAGLGLAGGRGVRFNGPASLPVAMALAHAVAHKFGFVACFDPKLSGYVVAISHDPAVRVGELIQLIR